MSKPAARIGDFHACPMVTPGTPPVPHVGGPVTGPGVPTVLICGQPAAVLGDMCTCVGPPDMIVLGSTGVLIGGKPAARMGDMCAHGGAIAAGAPTVFIGEVSPGAAMLAAIMQQFSAQVNHAAGSAVVAQKAMELANVAAAMNRAAEKGISHVPVKPVQNPQRKKISKEKRQQGKEMVAYLMRNSTELTPEMANAIVANLYDESRLKVDVIEKQSNNQGTKGYGLAQWTNTKNKKTGRESNRRTEVETFLKDEKAKGSTKTEQELQLDFLLKEIGEGGSQREFLVKSGFFNSEDTGRSSYEKFMRGFERPAENHAQERIAGAASWDGVFAPQPDEV